MTETKKLAVSFVLKDGQAADPMGAPLTETPGQLCRDSEGSGADMILIIDDSGDDAGHEANIGIIKKLARTVDIPIMAGGRVKRVEDVKKYLYAGARMVFLKASEEENIDILKEVSDRFGKEKIAVLLDCEEALSRTEEFAALGAGSLIAGRDQAVSGRESSCPVFFLTEEASGEEAETLLSLPSSAGVCFPARKERTIDFMELKHQLKADGIVVNTWESTAGWSDMKLGADGLLPVIVQDYKTSEVLMMAYMNEQAFQDTVRTGKMHYYSRSRKSQWLKGETSGHFQYVKSLHLDCDNDTLLAKVFQVGAACHTGSRSCFFQTLLRKDYEETNPLRVFEEVYQVIEDRKIHPKEGSYTNYLFDKGIDKILKKVGEEAAEIIIAAKNPDPEEIIYEISDFLYHAMVLMAEKGVTWQDITRELANR